MLQPTRWRSVGAICVEMITQMWYVGTPLMSAHSPAEQMGIRSCYNNSIQPLWFATEETMELTHSKGLMYPALKLSSFRVRRDSLPSAFELPGEIGRAASEPLPELRSTAFEEKALQENLKLLEEDENERAATRAAIAEEEAAAMRCEANRLAEENAKASEPDGTGENVVVVRRLCDMGFPEASVRSALASNDWDETAAINVLLSG